MLVASLAVLSGCSSNSDQAPKDFIGYALNAPVITTNAGTTAGASTSAQMVAGRLYPAAHLEGPKGQLIPNSDFLSTQVLPGPNQKVIFTFAQEAKFSDGAPVTCDSMLLAFTAGSMPDLFNSYLPLTQQVERVECAPKSRQATVVFKPGFGARWRELFGPGELLPAHAVAAKVGMDLNQLNAALYSRDEEALRPVAEAWSKGFNLANFDPALQVSSGPYRIEGIGERGEIKLVANPHYTGAKPNVPRLIIWPRGADVEALHEAGEVDVAELPSVEAASWVDRNARHNTFEVEAVASGLGEQLVLGSAGVFYDAQARRSFAACVDQAKVAKVSSDISGVQVEPLVTRTVRASDPVVQQLRDVSEPHLAVNLKEAKKAEGLTVRVGYAAPDERRAAMVAAIADSCKQAGITVVDASGEGSTMEALPRVFLKEPDLEVHTEGSIDALIKTVDPQEEFPQIRTLSTDVAAAREAERVSWEEVRTVPLATLPRVFVYDRRIENLVINTHTGGIGWNADRWGLGEKK